MLVGIHCEGTFDDKTLKELIKRIAIDAGITEEIKFRVKTADGSITKSSIEAALGLFLEIKPECSFGIFVTDTDGDSHKCSNVRRLVREACLLGIDHSFGVVGCPDPVIEEWFLDEENAIKNILGFAGTEPLPFGDIISPKDRYHYMISKSNDDITKTDDDVHLEIVRLIDMGKLRSSSRSFDTFYKDTLAKMRSLYANV
jgi:hypothetical protein